MSHPFVGRKEEGRALLLGAQHLAGCTAGLWQEPLARAGAGGGVLGQQMCWPITRCTVRRPGRTLHSMRPSTRPPTS